MARDRSKTGTDGPDIETMASTGPGIPDDALAPGEELPTPPTDEEVRRTARKLGVPGAVRNVKFDGKTLATGVAMGIGSAAIVAALLYATRPKRKK